MTPDRCEDVEFEMNHEMGNAEAREINRRVEHARAARRQPGPGLPERTSETTEETMSDTETLATVELDIDFDAVVPCQWFRPCASEAAWVGAHTCCQVEFMLCDAHRRASQQNHAEMRGVVACAHCRTDPMPEPAWRPV